MDKLIRRIDLTCARGEDAWRLLRQEWLATNGVGGYASGTIAGGDGFRGDKGVAVRYQGRPRNGQFEEETEMEPRNTLNTLKKSWHCGLTVARSLQPRAER